MIWKDILKEVEKIAEIAKESAKDFDDEKAMDFAILYPDWKPGKDYKSGERVLHNSTLYKIIQGHTSQDDWTPDNAPSLFAKILPGQGGTDIGEWQQPDSTNPYMAGDKVIYDGKIYVSLVDNNVWSPVTYPGGWKEVI